MFSYVYAISAYRRFTRRGGSLDAWFKISQRGSTVRQEVVAGLTTFRRQEVVAGLTTEVVAGLTTFLAMVYSVNNVSGDGLLGYRRSRHVG